MSVDAGSLVAVTRATADTTRDNEAWAVAVEAATAPGGKGHAPGRSSGDGGRQRHMPLALAGRNNVGRYCPFGFK